MRERALEIFLQLPDKFSVIPDVDTMNTALMLYFVKGQTDEAMKIWDEVMLFLQTLLTFADTEIRKRGISTASSVPHYDKRLT